MGSTLTEPVARMPDLRVAGTRKQVEALWRSIFYVVDCLDAMRLAHLCGFRSFRLHATQDFALRQPAFIVRDVVSPQSGRKIVAHGARSCEKTVAAGLSRHRGSQNARHMAG